MVVEADGVTIDLGAASPLNATGPDTAVSTDQAQFTFTSSSFAYSIEAIFDPTGDFLTSNGLVGGSGTQNSSGN